MWHVVGRQFAEHVVGQPIDDALSCLSAAAVRVLRLDVDDRRQHVADDVRLITASTHDHALTRCPAHNRCCKLEMPGKAQRVARPARSACKTQGLLDQSSSNFYQAIEGSSAVLTRTCMLRSSYIRCWMPAHSMKVGYANFHRFAPKIGYHSTIASAIAKRGKDWLCPPVCVLTLKICWRSV